MKRLLSLFSGCGGMDIGFEGNFECFDKCVNENLHSDWILKRLENNKVLLKPTDFETIFANDIRSDAKIAWVNYFQREGVYINESIVDLVKKYRNNEFEFPSDIDIVTGGFPCQDFSVAGKRMGFSSTVSHDGSKLKDDNNDNNISENRGNLYLWMKEVVSATKPLVFVAENVKGLVNLKDAKERIEKDFADCCDGGYLVVPARVLYAPDYGVPQSRERVIFFGFNKSKLTEKALIELSKECLLTEYDPYPVKTHSSNPNNKLLQYVVCSDVLNDLVEPEDAIEDLAQQKYSKAKYCKKGQGNVEIKLDDVAPTIRSEHHGNIEYRRLSLEHGGNHVQEIEKGLKERRLTVRECARLQTFPDNYEFVFNKNKTTKLSASSAYKIIGNAVPCLLAYAIADNLQKKWKLYFGK